MSELNIPEGKKALSRKAIRAMKPGTWVQVVWRDAPPEWAIYMGLDSPIRGIPNVLAFRKNPRRKHADAKVVSIDFDQIVDERPLVGPN